MKQLLLTFLLITCALSADSQTYVGNHKLDTLNRPFIVVSITSDQYFSFWKGRHVLSDIGKGENSLVLYDKKREEIRLTSLADLLSLFVENGWVKDDYQILKGDPAVGSESFARHIFIFKRKIDLTSK